MMDEGNVEVKKKSRVSTLYSYVYGDQLSSNPNSLIRMPPRAKRVLGQPVAVLEPRTPSPLKESRSNDLIPARSLTPELTHEPDVIESIEVSRSETPLQSLKDDSTDSELPCPICGEAMVSLLQLNRHLDDEHGFGVSTETSQPPTLQINGTPTQIITQTGSPSFINTLSPPANEELRSWLRKTNEVKTKLQATLPKSLAKLDIFDSNSTSGTINNGSMTPDSRTSSSASMSALPEIQVTRKHWQRPTVHDSCSFPGCKKPLNIKNGIINCRKCGLLYCHQHSSYRVKLGADAHYNHRGVWSRCCETCFINKPGYNDYGSFKVLTPTFKELRQKNIDERQLYENKLEKRVINLTSMLNSIDKEFNSSEFNSNFLNFKINSKKRQVEQQLVTWEDSAHVLNCFLCLRNFGFMLRKHHCRLCGRVVCGDIETGCSMEVPINHLTTLLDVPRVNDSSTIRMCRSCKNVLFLKRNFQMDTKEPLTPLLEKFETQQNVKRAILVLMPRFQDMLHRLQIDKNKSKSITQETSKLRKRLVDSFALFDKLTKEIVGLECMTRDETLLQLAIKTESASFIKTNMAPLKQLPELLQKIEADSKQSIPKPKFTRDQVAAIKRNREELMVLQEQRFLVTDMIETCKKQRRFDEITALDENLKELDKSIEQLQNELGDEGF